MNIFKVLEGKEIEKVNGDKFGITVTFTDGSKLNIDSDGPEGSKLSIEADVKVTLKL